MADIETTKPLGPVWPTRPGRRVEEDDKAKDERKQQKEKNNQQDQGTDQENMDDGSPHIDEYV